MSTYIQRALEMAQQAADLGEVPVGAVIVHQDKIIAEGFNQPIGKHDPCAHAEIMAMRKAGEVLQNYRLLDCDLYVTLEPCAMCAAAMVHARIRRCIFAASDPKTGVVASQQKFFEQPWLNHQVEVSAGEYAKEAGEMLRHFFRERR